MITIGEVAPAELPALYERCAEFVELDPEARKLDNLPPGYTTEVAGLLVFLLGGAAVLRHASLAVAMAIVASGVLALKDQLHASIQKLTPDEHLFLAVLHHAVGDMWSLVVLLRDLRALYAAARRGTPHAAHDITLNPPQASRLPPHRLPA